MTSMNPKIQWFYLIANVKVCILFTMQSLIDAPFSRICNWTKTFVPRSLDTPLTNPGPAPLSIRIRRRRNACDPLSQSARPTTSI